MAEHLPWAQASKTIYSDLDKAMPANLSLDSAGVYSAAYRFVAFALTPVQALVFSMGPRFFRAGERGVKAAWDLAASVVGWVVALSPRFC